MSNPLHRVGDGTRSFFGWIVRNGLIVTFAIIAALLITIFLVWEGRRAVATWFRTRGEI